MCETLVIDMGQRVCEMLFTINLCISRERGGWGGVVG